MKRINILITGVAGFIGSRLAKKLLENKKFVIYGVDNFSTGYKDNIPKNVKFYYGDLSNPQTLNNLTIKCDYIFHFAGQSSAEKSFEDPITDIKNNTLSTINLIDFAIKKKVKKIIYASSMSVYGNSKKGFFSETDKLNPLSCYGLSKQTSEKYLELFKKKVPFIILRLFNVYGPGQDMQNLKQGMVSIFISQALKKKEVIVKGKLTRFRDFVPISLVTSVCVKLIGSKFKNEIFNVGIGRKKTISSLLQIIFKFTGNKKVKISKNTPGDQHGAYANNKKIITKLKIKPEDNFSIDVKDFIDWASIQKWKKK